MKIKFKTWYWGNYVKNGAILDGSRITINTEDFEEYIEELHGWQHSEEFKQGHKQFSKQE